MNKWLLIFLVGLTTKAFAFNENEWSMRSGTIVVRPFRIDITVGGAQYYYDTAADKDAADAKFTAAGTAHTIAALAQAADDVAISTTIAFSGFEEFRNCMTKKSGVVAKIKQIGIDGAGWQQLLTWFPGQAATLQPIIDDLRHQVQLLYRPYASLQ